MKKLSGWKLTVVRLLALGAVIGLTVFLVVNRDKIQKLEALGYPGIFLISVLSNATLILPVPGVLFTSAMGAVFNPWGVALAAGTGATVGELTGYIAGFSGQGVIENQKWYDRISGWMKKYGGIIILIMATIPNPLFDIAGMVAGSLKMPMWKFLLWSFPGKCLKMLAFALGGAGILRLF